MAAHAIDRRHKILHAYERRLGPQRAIGDLIGVSISFKEKTGSGDPMMMA